MVQCCWERKPRTSTGAGEELAREARAARFRQLVDAHKCGGARTTTGFEIRRLAFQQKEPAAVNVSEYLNAGRLDLVEIEIEIEDVDWLRAIDFEA
jgi:hypothetical protein